MANSKGPDWARTGTVVAYAEWLRSKSDAIAVLVVRRDDAALAVHDDCSPGDAQDLIVERVIELARNLDAARKQKKKAARIELGPGELQGLWSGDGQ